MPYRLIIVPGENAQLRALPTQFADDVQTMVLDSANDALWEVRSAPPEAIVADVDLPGMSGFDLAEILPNFGVTTKIVLWSRSPSAELAQQASSAGVHRFLSGNLAADELRAALYDVLHSTVPVAPDAPEAAPPPVPAESEAPPPPVVAAPEPVKVAAVTPPQGRPPAPEPRKAAAPEPRKAAAPEPRKAAAQPTPAAPAGEEPRRPQRRREGPLVLTAENLTPIRRRLSDLAQDLGSDCILLTDRSGMPLVEVGSSSGLPMMILGPLLSTSFSTTGELSRQLREEEATTLYMHEGGRYDLYCFDINQRFLIVIVFDKKTAPNRARIGSVWVYAKRAIRDLEEALS